MLIPHAHFVERLYMILQLRNQIQINDKLHVVI
jgi:hypothetical protein